MEAKEVNIILTFVLQDFEKTDLRKDYLTIRVKIMVTSGRSTVA